MNTNVTIPGLFLEGFLSFFIPCFPALILLYAGCLTAGLKTDERHHRLQVFLLTLCFVLGICTMFLFAMAGSAALQTLLNRYMIQFLLCGGILLAVFGLHALGVIRIPFLMRELRADSEIREKASYVQAYLLGFFFSFAWSLCADPLLASARAASAAAGSAWYFLACVLGAVIPFIALGLFAGLLLQWLKNHLNLVKYSGVAGGIAVCVMGVYMLGAGNQRIIALERSSSAPSASQTIREEAEGRRKETAASASLEESVSSSENTGIMMKEDGKTDAEKYNFTLFDSEGNRHTLTDYTGKPLILNFFGTWCYYCNLELPYLEETSRRDDVNVVLIAAPNLGSEVSEEKIAEFMKEAGYTLTVLYDRDYSVTEAYGISGYPTTFIMKPDGNYLGYVPGYVDEETLNAAIEDARAE